MPFSTESADPFGIGDGYTKILDYEATEEDKKLHENLKRMFDHASRCSLKYRRQCEINKAFLEGNYFIYRNRYTNEVLRLPVSDVKRLYSFNNQIAPTARSLTGKMSRLWPTFEAIPPTGDIDDIYTTRICEALFSFLEQAQKMQVKFEEYIESIVYAGTAVVQLSWDSTLGRKLAFCSVCNYVDDIKAVGEECPHCRTEIFSRAANDVESQLVDETAAANAQKTLEEMGELPESSLPPVQMPEPPDVDKIPTLISASEGDIRVDNVDISDVYVEPGIRDPECFRYIFKKLIMPVSEARAKFPEMAQFIGPDSSVSFLEDSSLAANTGSAGQYGEEIYNDHLYIYEYHEKATEAYPSGRIVWFTEKFVLDEKEGLYDCLGRLPFYWGWFERRPKSFYGESFIVQASSRQKELDSTETNVREYCELLVRPKTLIPQQARVASDEINATTSQVIKYNAAAGEIRFLVPPPLPSEVFNRGSMLSQDIQVAATVTDQEMGRSVADPNGRAMSILEAENSQQIAPIMTRNYSEWKQLYLGMLELAKKYYDKDRMVLIGGKDNAAEAYIWGHANFKPGFDIRLQVDDGLSQNKAVRLTQALDLAGTGILNDKQTGVLDDKKFTQLARIKVPGVGPDFTSPEYAAATEMAIKIISGEPVEPKPYDDPAIFRDVFLKFLRGRGRNAPPDVEERLVNAYMFYANWAMVGQPAADPMFGNSPQGGLDQTNPGGTPNNPGHLGTDMASNSSLMEDADSTLRTADSAAEGAVRGQQEHES